MPWTTQVLPSGVTVRYEGMITGDEIYRSKVDLFEHDFPTPPRYLLCDFTPVELFSVTPSEVDRIVELYRRSARRLSETYIAVVAPDALEYGLSLIWASNLEAAGFRVFVARTRQEALTSLAARGIRGLPREQEPRKRTSGPSKAGRSSGEHQNEP